MDYKDKYIQDGRIISDAKVEAYDSKSNTWIKLYVHIPGFGELYGWTLEESIKNSDRVAFDSVPSGQKFRANKDGAILAEYTK